MASQISHVIYSEKYFSAIETGKLSSVPDARYPAGKINKEEFILGVVFPDIRLIDNSIKRKDTHLCFDLVDLDFSGLTSFQAGWKFHLYCDMKREEILNKYDFYSLDRTADFYGRAAKILEDEIIYDCYNNWEKISNLFNNPPETETGLPISQDTINFWYAIWANYVKQKPDQRQMSIVMSKLTYLSNKEGIAETISQLRKNKKVVSILKKVKEEII